MPEKIGRPRTYSNLDGPLNITSVRLSDWHERQAKKLGRGTISKGIRRALESTDKSGTYPVENFKDIQNDLPS